MIKYLAFAFLLSCGHPIFKDKFKGKDGDDGPKGPHGIDGVDGKDGVKGRDGKDGLAGKRGNDGINGTRGLRGTPGPKGDQGPRGPQGPRGNPGIAGSRGATGSRGMQGPGGKPCTVQTGKDGTIYFYGGDGSKVSYTPYTPRWMVACIKIDWEWQTVEGFADELLIEYWSYPSYNKKLGKCTGDEEPWPDVGD